MSNPFNLDDLPKPPVRAGGKKISTAKTEAPKQSNHVAESNHPTIESASTSNEFKVNPQKSMSYNDQPSSTPESISLSPIAPNTPVQQPASGSGQTENFSPSTPFQYLIIADRSPNHDGNYMPKTSKSNRAITTDNHIETNANAGTSSHLFFNNTATATATDPQELFQPTVTVSHNLRTSHAHSLEPTTAFVNSATTHEVHPNVLEELDPYEFTPSIVNRSVPQSQTQIHSPTLQSKKNIYFEPTQTTYPATTTQAVTNQPLPQVRPDVNPADPVAGYVPNYIDPSTVGRANPPQAPALDDDPFYMVPSIGRTNPPQAPASDDDPFYIAPSTVGRANPPQNPPLDFSVYDKSQSAHTSTNFKTTKGAHDRPTHAHSAPFDFSTQLAHTGIPSTLTGSSPTKLTTIRDSSKTIHATLPTLISAVPPTTSSASYQQSPVPPTYDPFAVPPRATTTIHPANILNVDASASFAPTTEQLYSSHPNVFNPTPPNNSLHLHTAADLDPFWAPNTLPTNTAIQPSSPSRNVGEFHHSDTHPDSFTPTTSSSTLHPHTYSSRQPNDPVFARGALQSPVPSPIVSMTDLSNANTNLQSPLMPVAQPVYSGDENDFETNSAITSNSHQPNTAPFPTTATATAVSSSPIPITTAVPLTTPVLITTHTPSSFHHLPSNAALKSTGADFNDPFASSSTHIARVPTSSALTPDTDDPFAPSSTHAAGIPTQSIRTPHPFETYSQQQKSNTSSSLYKGTGPSPTSSTNSAAKSKPVARDLLNDDDNDSPFTTTQKPFVVNPANHSIISTSASRGTTQTSNDDPFSSNNHPVDPFNQQAQSTINSTSIPTSQSTTKQPNFPTWSTAGTSAASKPNLPVAPSVNLLDFDNDSPTDPFGSDANKSKSIPNVVEEFERVYHVNMSSGRSHLDASRGPYHDDDLSANDEYDSFDEGDGEGDHDGSPGRQPAVTRRGDMKPSYQPGGRIYSDSIADTNEGRYSTSLRSGDVPCFSAPGGVISEGHILGRLSSRSLFVKDWAPMYWVIREGVLVVYRSKEDSQPGTRREPKKRIILGTQHRVLNIKSKQYRPLGLIYNFMLEEVMDYGPVNAAKFGGHNKAQVELLWARLRDTIATTRRITISQQKPSHHY